MHDDILEIWPTVSPYVSLLLIIYYVRWVNKNTTFYFPHQSRLDCMQNWQFEGIYLRFYLADYTAYMQITFNAFFTDPQSH